MPIATQQEFEWKVGDKAFYEHKEVTIDRIADDCVREVNDGRSITSGHRFNEHIFPVTEGGRAIVDWFHEQYEALCQMPGNRLLNWPRLAAVINNKFVEAMRHFHAKNLAESRFSLVNAAMFFNTVKDLVASVTEVELEGIKIFKE